ncbi:MAG TPA: Calx-beta domain-containing protein, partial [Pyrinomonadaceae bacterium]
GNTSEFSVCYEANAPGTVQFTAASFGAGESKGTATVVVTRTLGTAGAAGVDYSTADGTAAAGEDYAPASGTLQFAPGETTKSFTVSLVNDARDENEESFQLTLSNPTGGIVLGAGSAATVSVSDDDPRPALSVRQVIVAEGNSGTTPAVFGVRLSAPSGKVVTVNYATGGGSASPGQDFQDVSGTLVFNPGETTKQVSVVVNGDTLPERDELFTFAIFQPTNATLAGFGNFYPAAGVIWDDDSDGIHFSAPNYAANETDGSTTVKVVRRGDASAPARAFYSASGTGFDDSPGLASHRRDFTYATGTLQFAAGETEKTFTVLLNDDAFVEEPETVNLTLFDLALPAEPESLLGALLTIASDDAQPPTAANNPADRTDFFVRQHYHDFLNREPDASGLAHWTGEIEQCGTNAQCREVRRVNVSTAFFLSIEFQQTGYRVFRFYRATFPPTGNERERGMPYLLEFLRDTQEIGRGVVVGQPQWEERLRQQVAAFARAWVERDEFVAEFPASMTAAQFVDRLFANSGVASPPAAERAAAVAAYGAGGTEGRAAALLSVTDSGSVFNKQYNPAFVYMQYVGYLRRAPNELPDSTLAGFDFWLSKLDSFTL